MASMWGALIVAILPAAIALPWALGLLVAGPWLGHASWHAYQVSAGFHPKLPRLPAYLSLPFIGKRYRIWR